MTCNDKHDRMRKVEIEALDLIRSGQPADKVIGQIERHPFMAGRISRHDLANFKSSLRRQAKAIQREFIDAHIIGNDGLPMCGAESTNIYDLPVKDVTNPVTVSVRQLQTRKRKHLEGNAICVHCWKAVIDEVEAAWRFQNNIAG